ncbi:MAG: lipid-A-disaccharide synthase N-terminal domain-containing protein [Planctomycetaceae bacterium]
MFSARFVVQWLSSERAKKSVTPPMFWYFSIGGAIMLMVYGIHRNEVVIIFGQSTGLFIYARNLQLIVRERKALAAGSDSSAVAGTIEPHRASESRQAA